MGELVERWLGDLARRGRSERTLTSYRQRLAVLERDACGRPVEQLTRDDVQRWIDGRGGDASRSAHRTAAVSFWSWLVDEGHAPVNVAERCHVPIVRPGRPRPVAVDELARAVTVADTRMRVMLLLGALAGLRVAEMAALRWEHIDLSRHELIVVRGKGGRDRVVPLAGELERSLLELGQQRRAPVLRSQRDGGHLTWREVSSQIGRFLRGLGIDATAHQLRHTFGTAVYGATRDVYATSQLLGHQSPATTAIYARFDLGTELRLSVRELTTRRDVSA